MKKFVFAAIALLSVAMSTAEAGLFRNRGCSGGSCSGGSCGQTQQQSFGQQSCPCGTSCACTPQSNCGSCQGQVAYAPQQATAYAQAPQVANIAIPDGKGGYRLTAVIGYYNGLPIINPETQPVVNLLPAPKVMPKE